MSENELRDWQIRQYYEQEELVELVTDIAEYREFVPSYPESFGRRPDAVNFPGDFNQFVDNGAVSFHMSVERWRNPLMIDRVSDLDKLRESWDLVIDIDCDESFELSKEACKLVIDELKQHGIENISVKFSGNRGFHIGVRGEAFPDKIGDETFNELYPHLARAVVDYIRENLRDILKQKVREYNLGDEMATDSGEDPFQVVDIENDWGQRHLFRMPYSLHDSTGLVSLPIRPDEVDSFEKKDAEIENVEFNTPFLSGYEEGEAVNLAERALDFVEDRRAERKKKRVEGSFERPEDAIPEKHFPPTIKNILTGLEDGRKRGLFILINFYRCLGYEWDEIERKMWEWNDRNSEPLREAYVKAQLRWHRNRDEDVPPPNYDSKGYYKDMQVYEGDSLEEKVSNPISYAFRKAESRDEEGDEDLVCPYCGKEYEIESYYREHVQKCFE